MVRPYYQDPDRLIRVPALGHGSRTTQAASLDTSPRTNSATGASTNLTIM
jgi:hypothetical protein